MWVSRLKAVLFTCRLLQYQKTMRMISFKKSLLGWGGVGITPLTTGTGDASTPSSQHICIELDRDRDDFRDIPLFLSGTFACLAPFYRWTSMNIEMWVTPLTKIEVPLILIHVWGWATCKLSWTGFHRKPCSGVSGPPLTSALSWDPSIWARVYQTLVNSCVWSSQLEWIESFQMRRSTHWHRAWGPQALHLESWIG